MKSGGINVYMQNRTIFLLFFLSTVILPASGFSPAKEMTLRAPEIESNHWINSDPLNWDALKGKVALVEFWTFECYNCKNVEPYVKTWYEKFRDKGFEVVAVHSPEFERERDVDNVRRYVKEHDITYPVAIDNDFKIWRRFSNRYWPAMYLVDKQGNIRYRYIGEGRYKEIENRIEQLLTE